MEWSDRTGEGTLTDTTVVSDLTATTSSRCPAVCVGVCVTWTRLRRQQRLEAARVGVGLHVQMKIDVTNDDN